VDSSKAAMFLEAERRGLLKGKNPALIAEARRRFLGQEEPAPTLPVQEGNEPSKLESLARGAGQGVTFGAQDELSAAAEPLINKLGDMLPASWTGRQEGMNVSDLPQESYEQRRDAYRNENREAQIANPGTYFAGQMLGSVPSMAVGGTSVAGQMAAGGAMGAATGAGYSEAEDLEGIAKDTGLGVAIGGLSPALLAGIQKYGMAGIQKVAPKLAAKLRSGAEKTALNATGATAAEVKNFKPGTGGRLLDDDMIKPFMSQSKLSDRIASKMDEYGGQIGGLVDDIDDIGMGVSRSDVIAKLKRQAKNMVDDQAPVGRKLQRIIKDLESGQSPKYIKGKEQLERLYAKMDDIEDLRVAGKPYKMKRKELEKAIREKEKQVAEFDLIRPSEAEAKKRGFQAQSNYAKPLSTEANKKAATVFREEVENLLERASPESAEAFKKAKDQYGYLAPVQEASARRANVTQQSPALGWGDLTMFGLGTAGGLGSNTDVGAALGGAALLGARRFAAPRAATTLASGLNKASKMVGNLPKASMSEVQKRGILGAARGTIPGQVEKQKLPIEYMGKYSQMLQQEEEKSPEHLSRAHYVLYSRDPEYQEAYKQAQKQKQEQEEKGEVE
jgi:hypothetical protein